jgi:hypothetical protein
VPKIFFRFLTDNFFGGQKFALVDKNLPCRIKKYLDGQELFFTDNVLFLRTIDKIGGQNFCPVCPLSVKATRPPNLRQNKYFFAT